MNDRAEYFPYFPENKAHLYAHFVCISAEGFHPSLSRGSASALRRDPPDAKAKALPLHTDQASVKKTDLSWQACLFLTEPECCPCHGKEGHGNLPLQHQNRQPAWKEVFRSCRSLPGRGTAEGRTDRQGV